MEENLTKAKSSVDGEAAMETLMEAGKQIATISDYRKAHKKQFGNLSRLVNVLEMIFMDLKKSREQIPDEAVQGLVQLWDALDAARKLFEFVSHGSMIYLVLEREKISKRFEEVTAQIIQALDSILLDKLGIDDEMRVLVEFLHFQFQRANKRVDMPDTELYDDISFLYEKANDSYIDPEILGRLAVKLELCTIYYIGLESLSLSQIVAVNGDPEQRIEKMLMLLEKIENYVQTYNPKMIIQSNLKILFSDRNIDFRCPICHGLMRDPVVVATGQSYDRDCIQKWIDAGHDTCPMTQKKLPNTTLVPNKILAIFIAKCCEANDVDPPQHPSKPGKPSLLL